MSDNTVPLRVLIPPPAGAAELGLQNLLTGDARFALVGTPSTEVRSQAAGLRPDLIVLDPQADGELDLDRIATFAKAAPRGHVCLYTDRFDCRSFLDAMRAGARGYLLK
jgi:DNA-binding NarL/FixJ family response regulator